MSEEGIIDNIFKDSFVLKEEIIGINQKFQIINSNMIAIGMDYKYYIDSKIDENKIFDLRNNIIYRLESTLFHVNILVNIINSLDDEMTKIYQKENHNALLHSHFNYRKQNISSLFDSIIFHIISTFDFISNLIAFVGLKNHKKFKWTQLIRSLKDSNAEISKLPFKELLIRLDNTFIRSLYDHRSYLIHIGADENKASFSINVKKACVDTKIFSSDSFNKKFDELKKVNKVNEISIPSVLVWMLKKSSVSIIEIQYAIKDFLSSQENDSLPLFFLKGPKGEIMSPSAKYWK